MEIINERSSSFPQIMITLLETGLRMLSADHTLQPLVAMARTPPVMNRTNTLMSVRDILEIIALH